MYRGFRQELTSGRATAPITSCWAGSIRFTSDAQSQQFFQEVAERARTVSGVKAVTMTTAIPMLNDSIGALSIAPEGFQFPPGKDDASTLASMVDEYYFDAMGIPLVAGRNFTRRDDENGPRVGIVNQHLAQHYWPNQDPLGKRFLLKDGGKNAWVEIVGVAKTTKYLFIAEPPSDFVYIPYRQNTRQAMMLVAQSAGDPSSLAAPLRRSGPRPRRQHAGLQTCGRWKSCIGCARSASSTCWSARSPRWA